MSLERPYISHRQRSQARAGARAPGRAARSRRLTWHHADVEPGAYRGLARVPGYPSLITAVFLSRMANSMSQVGVVIYLLERTGSPAVAGAGAAAQLLPGIASGPFVGAWLGRAASRRR